MLTNMDLQLACQYAPILSFDENEPFLPIRIGVTVLRSAGPSPSFPRSFAFDDDQLEAIVEYAIYWDYDITHLYDLEHVWVYVGKDGSVLDCEGSFHGKYLKGLLEDRSNLTRTQVRLLSQPGKHAISPIVDIFKLWPGAVRSCQEDAGKDGLILTAAFRGAYETTTEINRAVYSYMQRQYRFTPTWRFVPFNLPEEIFVSWEELRQEVPVRIAACLDDIWKTIGIEEK